MKRFENNLNAKSSHCCNFPCNRHSNLINGKLDETSEEGNSKQKKQKQGGVFFFFGITKTFGSIFCSSSPARASPLTLSKTLLHLSGGLDAPSKEGIRGKDVCPFKLLKITDDSNRVLTKAAKVPNFINGLRFTSTKTIKNQICNIFQ